MEENQPSLPTYALLSGCIIAWKGTTQDALFLAFATHHSKQSHIICNYCQYVLFIVLHSLLSGLVITPITLTFSLQLLSISVPSCHLSCVEHYICFGASITGGWGWIGYITGHPFLTFNRSMTSKARSWWNCSRGQDVTFVLSRASQPNSSYLKICKNATGRLCVWEADRKHEIMCS